MATCLLLSWKLSKLDKPDMQDTAGEAGTNSQVMYSYGPPHMAKQKQDDQYEHTFSNYVRIRDVAQKTCQRRWTIRKSSEGGSGISVLPAQHDDDDDYIADKQRINDPWKDEIEKTLVWPKIVKEVKIKRKEKKKRKERLLWNLPREK